MASLTRVKNDGDIIEEFVRHTARFVDALVVVDNASLDATRDVLSALAAEGLPLTVRQDDFIEGYDWIMTDLTREVLSETGADYLLVLDADEFVRAPSREALERSLRELPPGSHGLVGWVTYVPTPEDPADEPRLLARIGHRRRAEVKPICKAFVSRSFLGCPEAVLNMGNHGIADPLERFGNVVLEGVQLAHFPVRSISQVQNKGVLGWSSFLAMGYEGEQLAHQWRRVYENVRRNPHWSPHDLFACALDYYRGAPGAENAEPELVYDPLPVVDRRYAAPVPDVTETAIAYAAQLARSYARLRSENIALRAALEKTDASLEPV